MPRMIPQYIGPDTASSAEKKLFRAFQAMPDTENWTIFHSVGLAGHPTQSEGEADFVAVIPEMGTFTIEVKGGGIRRDERGRWFSVDRDGIEHSIKNPVSEASAASQAIKTFVKNNTQNIGQNLQATLFGYGVFFPDILKDEMPQMIEIDDAQIGDMDDAANPRNYLVRLAGYWKSSFAASPMIRRPNAAQAARIASILKPSVNLRYSLNTVIHSLDMQAIRLTERQAAAFTGVCENPRCLVRGGAGTGKTVLALGYAEKKAREGLKVGLFCYNKKLAETLRERAEAYENLDCYSLTEMMDRACEEKGLNLPAQKKADYYMNELPLNYLEYVQPEPVYDVIVLDEGQDLMRGYYPDILDMLLKGGLKNGKWCFFMDADRQNIYQQGVFYEDIVYELEESRNIFFARYTLTENCRNSPSIIRKIDAVFHTNTMFRTSAEPGPEVKIKTFRRAADQLEGLKELLESLHRGGVPAEDIVILSKYSFNRSVIYRHADFPVSEEYPPEKGKILYSTISSFKGLDSPVIILLSVIGFEGIDKDLLYIGMSRAKAALYMFVQEDTWKRIVH